MKLEDFINFYTQYATTNNFGFRRALLYIYQKGDDRSLVAYVENPSKSKQLGVEPVRSFISLFQQYQCNQGILISQQPLSKDASDELSKTGHFIQHFLETEIITCATALKHFLNPSFEVLPQAEVSSFLKSQKLKLSQMPLIHSKDPICRYFNLRPGNVVKEINHPVAGEGLVDTYVTFSAVD